MEGVAVIVEPFDDYSDHYYYRLDEMPAYQFVREDVEAISWLMLTIGDACARCGEQSRFVWLTRDFVEPSLPESRARLPQPGRRRSSTSAVPAPARPSPQRASRWSCR